MKLSERFYEMWGLTFENGKAIRTPSKERERSVYLRDE